MQIKYCSLEVDAKAESHTLKEGLQKKCSDQSEKVSTLFKTSLIPGGDCSMLECAFF